MNFLVKSAFSLVKSAFLQLFISQKCLFCVSFVAILKALA